MVKRKQPPERSPSPTPKRLREAGVKFIILPPDAPTIKSYGADDQDELKAKASAQLEFLVNQAAILRDAPLPYVLFLARVVLLTSWPALHPRPRQPTPKAKERAKQQKGRVKHLKARSLKSQIGFLAGISYTRGGSLAHCPN
jgi:hypothetical protein